MSDLIGRALQNRNIVKKIYVEDDQGRLQEIELAPDGKTIISATSTNATDGSGIPSGTAGPGQGPQQQKPNYVPTPQPREDEPDQPSTVQEMESILNKSLGGKAATTGNYDNEKNRKKVKPNGEIEDNKIDPVFRSRLMSVMTDNKYDRKLKGRKRGKLDMHRLYKGQVGAKNLFVQKMERKGKEYNIMLLIDESGSMHGSPIVEAANVAEFLVQNFENPNLNINVGVMGFQDYNTHHKKMGDNKVNTEVMKKEILENNDGGTNDYEALVEGYKQFKGKSGTNIMIMLTDGESGRRDDCLRIVTSNEDVATFGIGIGTEAAQIPTHVMANNLEELKPLILQTLKTKMKRGV